MTPSNATRPLSAAERERLRTLRLEMDWSYREMARRVGVPEPTLRQLLEGKRRPMERTIFKARRWMVDNAELLRGGVGVEAR